MGNDPKRIVQGLRAIIVPRQVTELRALNVRTAEYRAPHTVSGYFNDIDALAEAAAAIDIATGIYFVPNPINPALLARAENRVRAHGKGDAATSDGDIVRRHWLLIDCDPVRPAGISSTGSEHEAARQRARRKVREILAQTEKSYIPETVDRALREKFDILL